MANARTTLAASSQFATLATGVPTEGNDVLSGSGSDTVDGLGGNDYITGSTGGQMLIGGVGNDTLEGRGGPDTLVGGEGDDLYVLGRDAGMATIINADAGPNNNDVLYLKGVDESMLKGFERQGNDLIIRWGTDSAFTLKDAYAGAEHQITALRLYKFQSTTEEVLIPMRAIFERFVYALTDGDDILGPSDLSEQVSGKAGNDKIEMGAGNDLVYGGTGDDTLDGGTGNDILSGDGGSDVFVFRTGSGIDSVRLGDSTAGRTDTIIFEDVSVDGLTAVRRGSDMVLQYGDSDEVILVQHFSDPNGGSVTLQFSDGQRLSIAELLGLYPIRMSEGNDGGGFTFNVRENIYGGGGNDTILAYGGSDLVYGESGNDNLQGGNDNDTLLGGEGNDSVNGDAGDDLVEGGSEQDTLNGGSGADTLDGGAGNDRMIGDVGNDVFILRTGSGVDVISLVDNTLSHVDIVRFEDVASNELTAVKRAGANLILDYGNGDSVTLESYFTSGYYRFAALEFADVKRSTRPNCSPGMP